MLKYKLICTDLDDTLITSEAKLTERTKDAVRRYKEAGGRFCIVTGRMTPGAIPICKELSLDTETATYQGAVVTDLSTGEVIFKTAIENSKAVKILRYIESKGFYCQTYSGDEFWTRKAGEHTVLYGKLSCARYRETVVPLSEAVEKEKLEPPKILIMAEPEKVPAFKEELSEKFGDDFLINTSKPFIIEIIPKTISKAKAVESIAKRRGIKREEIICVGDSENDLTMLTYAGLGVAVSNASDYVKSFVKVVAPDNNSDGVAWVIDNYGLQEA